MKQCNCKSAFTLVNLLPLDIKAAAVELETGIYVLIAPKEEHNHGSKTTTMGSFQHMRTDEKGQLIGNLLYKTPQEVPADIEKLFWDRAAFYQRNCTGAAKTRSLLEQDRPEYKHIIYVKGYTNKNIYNRAR